jgi:hypothetical protein
MFASKKTAVLVLSSRWTFAEVLGHERHSASFERGEQAEDRAIQDRGLVADAVTRVFAARSYVRGKRVVRIRSRR